MRQFSRRAWRGGPESSEGGLACEVCGRLPAPPRVRLTLANVAMMVPIELTVNAAAVNTDLPSIVKILVMTAATSVLAIWVAEPSMMRLMHGWLHAPALRNRNSLREAPSVWRVRTVLDDEPGSLEHLTRSLFRVGVNILDIQVHPAEGIVLDELVVSAPEKVTSRDLASAIQTGGGRDSRIWPTTALALADPATRALSLALRVAADPEELPLATAELLRARVLTPGQPTPELDGGTVLKIPTSRTGAHVFLRPGEPFTRAEIARANRLAELAEQTEITRNAIRAHSPPPQNTQLENPAEAFHGLQIPG
jgi:hypothetical protein